MEVDGGGDRVLNHEKDNHVRIVTTQICLRIYTGYSVFPFSPFRVSSKRKTVIRLCNLSPPGPVGIWC